MDEAARPFLPLVGRVTAADQGPVVAVPVLAHVLLGDHDVAIARPDLLHDADMTSAADAEGAAIPLGHRADGRGVIHRDAVRSGVACPLAAVAEQVAGRRDAVDPRLDVRAVAVIATGVAAMPARAQQRGRGRDGWAGRLADQERDRPAQCQHGGQPGRGEPPESAGAAQPLQRLPPALDSSTPDSGTPDSGAPDRGRLAGWPCPRVLLTLSILLRLTLAVSRGGQASWRVVSRHYAGRVATNEPFSADAPRTFRPTVNGSRPQPRTRRPASSMAGPSSQESRRRAVKA